MHTVGNGYGLCVLGDLKGRVGGRGRGDMRGAFGVPKEKDNGRSVTDFCVNKVLYANNTLSSKRVCISTPGWLEARMEWR